MIMTTQHLVLYDKKECYISGSVIQPIACSVSTKTYREQLLLALDIRVHVLKYALLDN